MSRNAGAYEQREIVVAREVRAMRERRDSKFGVRSSEKFELRTLSPPHLVFPVSLTCSRAAIRGVDRVFHNLVDAFFT